MKHIINKIKNVIKIISVVICSVFFIIIVAGDMLQFVMGPTEETKTKTLIRNSAEKENQNGLEMVKADQAEGAIEHLQKALEYALQLKELEDNYTSKSLLGDIYNNFCYAYHQLDEYMLSLEYANKAIVLSPDYSVEYSNRGNAYLGLYQYEEALRDYDEALRLDSSNLYAYYGKGLIYYAQQKYEEAFQMMEKYLTFDDWESEAYLYMIWCCYYLGKYEKGLEISDKAISIFKLSTEFYDAKGQILQAAEGYDNAEQYYKTVASLLNGRAEAQSLLGGFYYNNGDYAAALDYFLDIKEVFPENIDMDNWIILCYTAMGDMEQAASHYRNIFDEGKATASLSNSIGNEYSYQGYYMESIDYFDKAIGIDPDGREAYINKLYSLYCGKRYSRCIEFGKSALGKFKDDIDILWYIGESYYSLSDYEEALQWYIRITETEPKNDTVLSYISGIYTIMEDYVNAEEYVERALSVNRNNDTALGIKATIADRKKPIVRQIREHIQDDYLYNDIDTGSINQLFQDDSMTNEDIGNALEQGKKEGDIFTGAIYDDYYDYYEMHMKNVDYVEYDDMDYIRIYDFNQNTDDQVIEILDSIHDTENRNLTIDLRQNSGGLTEAANNILDVLLADCVTCTIIYKDGYTYNYYSDASQIKFKNIYILVDGGSASASELLALGLKTYLGNVTVIGSNTYGKGVGQLSYEYKERKLMVFLVNHYWNVREQNIMEKGIVPDVHVVSEELEDYIKAIENDR